MYLTIFTVSDQIMTIHFIVSLFYHFYAKCIFLKRN